jgi:hypothetical protein
MLQLVVQNNPQQFIFKMMSNLDKPFILGDKELILRLSDEYEMVIGEFVYTNILHSNNEIEKETIFNPDGFTLSDSPPCVFPICYCIIGMSQTTFENYELVGDRYRKKWREQYNREYCFLDFSASINDKIEIIYFPTLYSIS